MKIQQLVIFCFALLISNLLYSQVRVKEGKGYFNITNIAEPQYLQSIDSSNLQYASAYIKKVGFAANTINGVFLNPNLSVGLGVGIQFTGYKAYTTSFTPDSTFEKGYFGDTHSITSLPVFADIRYYPKGSDKSLLFILDVGYAPLLKIKNKFDKMGLEGGALVKLGVGYRVPMGESISFLPALNFNAQRFGDNTTLGVSMSLGLVL